MSHRTHLLNSIFAWIEACAGSFYIFLHLSPTALESLENLKILLQISSLIIAIISGLMLIILNGRKIYEMLQTIFKKEC